MGLCSLDIIMMHDTPLYTFIIPEKRTCFKTPIYNTTW